MPQIGYKHTLRELETVQDAEQAIRRALLETKRTLERKSADHTSARATSLAGLASFSERIKAERESLAVADSQAALSLAETEAALATVGVSSEERMVLSFRRDALRRRLAATAQRREELNQTEAEWSVTEAALKKPHPWQGKQVRFTGGPHIETTVVPEGEIRQPDGTTKPRLRTTVTGTWDYEEV